MTEQFHTRIEGVAQQVLNRYGWRLVQPDDTDFINLIASAAVRGPHQIALGPDQVSDRKLARWVVHFYCQRLYEAYRQDNTEEQETAIRETYQFVRHKILPMTENRSVVEECAHYAATHIWHKLALIRESGAFLAYVCQIARRCILDSFRAVQEPLGEDLDFAEPMDELETDELRRELLEVISKCLSNEREIRFVIEFYLNDKSYLEIADEWQCTNRYLHLIGFRSRAKLKDCPSFAEWSATWAS